MEKELSEMIESFVEQNENFIMTEAMKIFIGTEDEGTKLQALELLRKMG